MTKIVMVKQFDEVMKERRLKAVRFSPQNFIEMFSSPRATKFITDADVPSDSAVIGVNYDPATCYFLLTIVSEKFDPVPEGAKIPVMDITAETFLCKCGS